MAGFDDFEDRDWRETLAELRLMVAGAGFGDWDAQAAAALDDDFQSFASPRSQLTTYVRSFESFLRVRSEWNLERMRARLGEILRDEEGRPVTGAIVVDAYGDRADDILDGRISDGLLEVVTAFSNALAGETGYFNGEENEE
ncbi:hypothetical protein [Novosphingobium sp. KA1]|uniref:hypothetical protein n=1 Tax=Novosphingobium sp. (strain KA1) TaxID=164608 RepID=UPI001A8E0303|nr:hypothetical protein [Novosphingobium sp. KA1]QSR19732.1 hypothetical protein CA833_21550 [Novosphingobium sp. KA1]